MTTEVDDFLKHYGVAGMKWGKSTGASRQARAGSAIEKSGGSKNKAAAKIAAKSIGTQILIKVGSNILGNVTGNKKVATGAAAVANIVNAGLTVRDANRVYNVATHK